MPPVLFRVTTRVCHSKGLVELCKREEVGVKEYVKGIKKCMEEIILYLRM
ncbi:hypothetical protein CULT_2550003 [[Clostridium] ultunense Esp]|nr:hypothetical protein CULT_2550003 [[Clostridium] ultunense Esp]